MSKIFISINQDTDEHYKATIHVVDHDLLNKSAVFSVEQKVEVNDNRAVNSSKVIFKKQLKLSSSETEIKISKEDLSCYSYVGKMISIKVLFKVKVDDGIIFDTKTSSELKLDENFKPAVITKAKHIVEPKDLFNFKKNFSAITASGKLYTLGLLVVGGVIIVINALVGLHDQFSPDSQTYLYSHTNSDGESQSPIVGALTGSGFLGLMVWLAIRRQLRKYMTFQINAPEKIKPGDTIKATDLVTGKSRVAIRNAIFRVVACNHEKGQYKRGSGSNVRTVSFQHPVQALILHEEKISKLRANSDISNYLNGTISFTNMFNTLYPPQHISRSHGIDIYWEIQLLHDDFVDQEIKCSSIMFDTEDFYLIHDEEGREEEETKKEKEDDLSLF